jgi:hypothetical protein
VHHPVKNKRGETIASAVTNLDLHDIARAAKTYGVKGFYVITPLADQQALVEKIVAHWTEGYGGAYNPARKAALDLVRVRDSLAGAVDEIKGLHPCGVRVVATCAARRGEALRFEDFRRLLAENRCAYLLVFGTAWGLTEAFINAADFVLEPIRGGFAYNHLSVRSAASIILDRVLGEHP